LRSLVGEMYCYFRSASDSHLHVDFSSEIILHFYIPEIIFIPLPIHCILLSLLVPLLESFYFLFHFQFFILNLFSSTSLLSESLLPLPLPLPKSSYSMTLTK